MLQLTLLFQSALRFIITYSGSYHIYLQLRASCFCVIRDVYWSKYPAHIADLSTGAYRPILLQVIKQI